MSMWVGEAIRRADRLSSPRASAVRTRARTRSSASTTPPTAGAASSTTTATRCSTARWARTTRTSRWARSRSPTTAACAARSRRAEEQLGLGVRLAHQSEARGATRRSTSRRSASHARRATAPTAGGAATSRATRRAATGRTALAGSAATPRSSRAARPSVAPRDRAGAADGGKIGGGGASASIRLWRAPPRTTSPSSRAALPLPRKLHRRRGARRRRAGAGCPQHAAGDIGAAPRFAPGGGRYVGFFVAPVAANYTFISYAVGMSGLELWLSDTGDPRGARLALGGDDGGAAARTRAPTPTTARRPRAECVRRGTRAIVGTDGTTTTSRRSTCAARWRGAGALQRASTIRSSTATRTSSAWYKIFGHGDDSTPRDFDDAHARCRLDGGHLATVTSAEEPHLSSGSSSARAIGVGARHGWARATRTTTASGAGRRRASSWTACRASRCVHELAEMGQPSGTASASE